MTSASVVVGQRLRKQFRVGSEPVYALRDVSLSVSPGEFLAIVGPSGSGKSTLLNVLGGIERPDDGAVILDGISLLGLREPALAKVRAEKIGFIFQTFNLLPVLTVEENVEYPLQLLGRPRREREGRVAELLEAVGLATHRRHRPAQLSGGQRQRAAIARALAAKPSVVLADEPTANLDHATGLKILDLLHDLNRQTGTTFIFSTHDPSVMRRAERLIELADGALKTP